MQTPKPGFILRRWQNLWSIIMIIIITMYIYRALINALSAHMIYINLNMIFYTHVEHSRLKNYLHKVLYENTHTHARTHARSHIHTHTHTHTYTHKSTTN